MSTFRFFNIADSIDPTDIATVKDKSLHVTPQETTDQIVNGLLSQLVGFPLGIAVEAVIDSYEITATPGHPFVASDFLVLAEDDRVFQAQVLSVLGDVLTLDSPVDYAFPVIGTFLGKVTHDLNVNGSVTRQTFSIGTPNIVTKDVHYRGLRINITDGVAMDDSKFGGITALTRGVTFRLVKNDGRRFNVANVKTNGDLGLFFDNKQYDNRGSGGGQYSLEITWKIAQDDGTVINIEPGDSVEVIVQDDLTALTSFRVWAFGHLNKTDG